MDDILLDDDANKAFHKIDGNIAGMEWETEPTEVELMEAENTVTNIHNNWCMSIADQYALLAENNRTHYQQKTTRTRTNTKEWNMKTQEGIAMKKYNIEVRNHRSGQGKQKSIWHGTY